MVRLRRLAPIRATLLSAIGLGHALPIHAAAAPPASCPASGCLNNSITKLPVVYLQPGLVSAVTVLSFVAGILSVIFLIVGGIRYTSSNGSPAGIQRARQTIMFAIIGLAISVLAPLIVGFVITSGPQ